MPQPSYQYIIILLCSLGIGTFSLCHAKRAVKLVEFTEEELMAFKNGKLPELANWKIALYILLNAGLGVLLLYRFGLCWDLLLYEVTAACLIGLSAVDFEAYEIPIEYNIIILILGISHLLLHRDRWLEYLLGFFAVSLVFLIISLVSKGKAMGGGDIKLMATVGLMIGWKQILLVMLLGCILGTVIYGIVMLIFRKKHVLAFGPYLSMATLISIFCGDEIIAWYVRSFFPAY